MQALPFADPVLDAQAGFRRILDAMARPGRIETLAALPPAVPAELGPASWALALTLLDFETPVWLSDALAPVAEPLRFYCGVPLASTPADAAFAFVERGWPVGQAVGLADFALGTPEYPDRSTTLVIEVEALAAGRGLTLSGPGIDGSARLEVAGIPGEFWQARQDLQRLYPLGLDLVLTCGDRLAALPRTTRLEF